MSSKLVVVTTLALAACSAVTTDPTTDRNATTPTEKVTVTTPKTDHAKNAMMTAASYGQGWCTWLFQCNPIVANATYSDVASCAVQKDASLSSLIDAPFNGITQAAQIQCATAMAAATCADRIEDLDACHFKGTQADDGACIADAQCKSGYCNNGAPGECGTCAERVPVGGDCTVLPCATGFVCDGATCIGRKGTGETGCRYGGCASATEICINDICQVPLRTGAACTVDVDPSADPCDAMQGEKCQGICVSVLPTLTVGDDCSGGNCTNSYCEPNTSTCVPFLKEGDACDATGQPCGGLMECLNGVCIVDSVAPKHACK